MFVKGIKVDNGKLTYGFCFVLLFINYSYVALAANVPFDYKKSLDTTLPKETKEEGQISSISEESSRYNTTNGTDQFSGQEGETGEEESEQNRGL